MAPPSRVAALMAVAAIGLAACGSVTPGEPTTPPTVRVTVTQTEEAIETTTATATATVTAPPAVETPTPPSPASTPPPDPTPTSDDEPTPDDEPAPPTADGIRGVTADAFDAVNGYWVGVFAGWHNDQGGPVEWVTPRRYHGDGFYDSSRGDLAGCHGDYDSTDNAFFCPDGPGQMSGVMAWDMDLFRMEILFGSAPIYAVVAHEFGHAGQTRFRADGEGGAAPPLGDAYVMYRELQADCFAGVALANLDGPDTVSADDYAAVVDATEALNTDGDHGTDAQRIAAFNLGFGTGDIESCLYNRGVPPHRELVGG